MLVLTRKQQQQIKIGEQITVTILRVKGNTVRLGIQAPREVRVVRSELPKDESNAVAESATVNLLESSILPLDIEVDASSGMDESSASEASLTEPEPIVFSARIKAGKTAAPVAAIHLPLRRINERHGAAPLKHLIASCATLAK